MLPCRGRALPGRVWPADMGQESSPPSPPHHPHPHWREAQFFQACLEGRGRQELPSWLQVTRLAAVRGHVGMKPGWTSRLRACLVCGLTSQLPSLRAHKRKSFQFKESNHCSCYEATVWKAFVDCVLKDSSVPFHTSLSHCVTFSVLAFFLILLAHATVKLQV